MDARSHWTVTVVVAGLWVAGTGSALAFGRVGHTVAGELAGPLLCAAARSGIEALGGGGSLGELGLWADEIREVPGWERSAPWHYMNIADEAPLSRYRSPAEGDVLWAIERFTAQLGDRGLAPEARGRALRFLVHFIVDIHQPLHVGRAGDRGGNTIAFDMGGERTNLHRLWDSGIIARDARARPDYGAAIAALAAAHEAEWSGAAPLEWAAESLRLRPVVYGFDRVPDEAYLDTAQALTRRRLAQAGVRLAATLNAIFCAPAE